MILVVSYSSALGGAERLLVELVSGLEEECRLACPPGPLAEAAQAEGIRVFALRQRSLRLRGSPAWAALDLVGHARELRRLARDLQPSLIVAWSMRPVLACALAHAEPPVVFQHNDFLPGPAVGRTVRSAAKRVALVIAPSQAVARDLDPDGRLAAPVRVVHPGVDVSSFTIADAPRPAPEPPRIVVVGAIAEWKRPDLALEAFALLRQHRAEATLRFVGAPVEGAEPLAAALRERARALGGGRAIQFAGHVDDIGEELSRATCLLHCADREPFGRVVLEALAAGRPVVVPNGDSGVSEIVDHSCARVYPPGDAAAAAEALAHVLADPDLASRMGAAGRSLARRKFDRAAAQNHWAAEVRSVIRREHQSAADAAGGRSVALVTVTHNSAVALRALLESVDRHLPAAEVVVVDNASSDESVAIARGRPRTIVYPLPENLGFARACNRGVATVKTSVTMLLNPDVELLDDSLLELALETRRRDRPERLLAPLVLSGDGSRQDTVHPLPTSLADLAGAVLSPAILPMPWLAPWRSSRPRRVGWAVGCALVGRTETFRRLGPFDERLFMFGEDLELGLRCAQAGVETWFWPSARVVHHGAHATSPAFGGEPFERLARARRAALASRRGALGVSVDDAAQAVTFATRIAVKRMLGGDVTRERHQLAALAAARRAPR